MRFFVFHADCDRIVRVIYCTGTAGSRFLRTAYHRLGGKPVPTQDVDLLAARLAFESAGALPDTPLVCKTDMSSDSQTPASPPPHPTNVFALEDCEGSLMLVPPHRQVADLSRLNADAARVFKPKVQPPLVHLAAAKESSGACRTSSVR